jgi:hypothetical protein
MPGQFIPLKERLLQAMTVDGNGCWICDLGGKSNPYGKVKLNGTRIAVPNHRASWMVYRGPIPDGMCVLHRCDTPKCINPDHLFIGSHADNASDRDAKGRAADRRGEKCATAYLRTEQVLEIRSLWDAGFYTQKEIGEMFGTSEDNVGCIVHRKTWKHI